MGCAWSSTAARSAVASTAINGHLENVGEFVKVPNAYRGPVPPGWIVYEGGYPLPKPEKPDEEPAPTPPPE
jgi:hypothetical protein